LRWDLFEQNGCSRPGARLVERCGLFHMTNPVVFRSGEAKWYSVDVLCNGSEFTGTPTVFLSVYRESIDDNLDNATVLARYAVSGLGDLLARAAADQRYKLGAVRALLLPNNDTSSLWGLPALHQALRQAGAASYCVVSGELDKVANDVLQVVDGDYRQHFTPLVRTCQVPGDGQWWRVYHDDQVVIHARTMQESSCVVYLYTLLSWHHGILVCTADCLPPECRSSSTTRYELSHRLQTLFGPLPVLDHERVTIGGLIVLPSFPNLALETIKSTLQKAADHHDSSRESAKRPRHDKMWTVHLPLINRGVDRCPVDRQLLVRAWQQGDAHHALLSPTCCRRLCPDSLPTKTPNPAVCLHEPILLTTGMNLCWNASNGGNANVVNRLEDIKLTAAADVCAPLDPVPPSFRSLPTHEDDQDEPGEADTNEIDLEDTTSQTSDCKAGDEDDLVQLLVLGTGSAAPSPHRGSAGYVLLFPVSCSSLLQRGSVVVLEAGEGFVTQWNRYAPRQYSFPDVCVIWISHAHWDHYGGLVPLLVAIRQCGPTPTPPLVIAPRKILQYLALMLSPTSEYFVGSCLESNAYSDSALESAFSTSNPFLVWRNVRVDHSCASAYGFVTAMQSRGGIPFIFSYSGDTRPCRSLVAACHVTASEWNRPGVDFMIHEATYDEHEQEMSLAKKHSTINEAIFIGKETNTQKLLLSHFSQRYRTVSAGTASGSPQVGVAVDGLILPLLQLDESRNMANTSPVSQTLGS
jgi:ribonuclease BN (tRNA processing enzyme)